MNLPNEQVMREMSKIALEQATTMFAKHARVFAQSIPDDIDGKTALLAFANAIESTNATMWPKPNEQ